MGAPSIDGGMTSEEYKSLQADERAWAASQEEAAYQRSLEMEADRRDFELAQQEKIGSIEDAEQLAIQDSEKMLQAEMKDLGIAEDKSRMTASFESMVGVPLDAQQDEERPL